MNTEATLDQEALREELEQAQVRVRDLVADRTAVEAELENISGERKRYELLREVCDGLDSLSDLGAAELFWGDRLAGGKADDHVRRVRSRMDVFFERLGKIERRRQTIIEDILEEQERIEFLEEDLFQAQQAEERRKLEWIVEREISALPERQAVMPWTRGAEDDRRFRKSLTVALAFSLLVALIIPQIDLPLPDIWERAEVPERLVELIEKKYPEPPPVATMADVPEKPPEPEAVEPEPEPEPETEAVEEKLAPQEGTAVAESTPAPKPEPGATGGPKRPESQGILAFREKFAGLADKTPGARLGADARISTSGEASNVGRPERNMVSTQAPGSSGGINLASLSRDVGGGGGGQMGGVQVTRATSRIGGDGSGNGTGAGRPRAGEVGSSRTDEEIQIVFDRHKSALYRLYNRELRKNPTLQGQMVLRLRIEPDGSVTLCEVQSTDMNAPQLADQVVSRVKSFDFGAKEVPPVVIVYPIDFLPAA
ncbi:MAG: AgmX/PglI C-terminal domain-containing protein [Gammaproteobacteria bacterium]